MEIWRSFGCKSLTTSPSIEIVPADISSKPATILKVVDLPQPEGPTKTINSLSLISRLNLWTTSTNLTRLRHMFAHAWTREKNFLYYKKRQEQFKNNNNDEEIAETDKFYSIFKKENVTNEEIESLLKKYIELMRLVLINYCKITKLKPK